MTTTAIVLSIIKFNFFLFYDWNNAGFNLDPELNRAKFSRVLIVLFSISRSATRKICGREEILQNKSKIIWLANLVNELNI